MAQNKDIKRFNLGMNKDDSPADLQPGEYTDALNMRIASSDEQQGIGVMETLQGEVEVRINVSITYYGGAIGGQFIYESYGEVEICNQIWMGKNWDADYPGSKVYDDNEANRAIYGGLYTWDMLQNANFCPAGWRVPTEEDIDELLTCLGGALIAGGKLKASGVDNWLTPNTGGDNSSGFKALPGGIFDIVFDFLGRKASFWINKEIGLGALTADNTVITADSTIISTDATIS